MKIEIKYTLEADNEFDSSLREQQKALQNAFVNELKINSLYSEVFRKIIKYSNDEVLVENAQKIWQSIVEHFEMEN